MKTKEIVLTVILFTVMLFGVAACAAPANSIGDAFSTPVLARPPSPATKSSSIQPTAVPAKTTAVPTTAPTAVPMLPVRNGSSPAPEPVPTPKLPPLGTPTCPVVSLDEFPVFDKNMEEDGKITIGVLVLSAKLKESFGLLTKPNSLPRNAQAMSAEIAKVWVFLNEVAPQDIQTIAQNSRRLHNRAIKTLYNGKTSASGWQGLQAVYKFLYNTAQGAYDLAILAEKKTKILRVELEFLTIDKCWFREYVFEPECRISMPQ